MTQGVLSSGHRITNVSFIPPKDLFFLLVSGLHGAPSPSVWYLVVLEMIRAQPPEWLQVKFWLYQFPAVKLILQGSVYSGVKWTNEGRPSVGFWGD